MKTIAELVEEFVEHRRSLRFSAETIRKEKGHLLGLVNWLKTEMGVERPEFLQTRHLQQWHLHMANGQSWLGQPRKAVTVNRHLIAAKNWVGYLAKQGVVQRRLLESLPYLKEPKFLPGSVLPHAQMMKLIGSIAADDPAGFRNRTMLEVLYSSGIRAGEILGLNLEDVDIPNGTILVMGKGRKQRVVPVGKTALSALESYIKAVRPFVVQEAGERAIFLGVDGKRFSYMAFWRMVNGAAKRAGLEKRISPHTFRRSCATELVRAGANLYHVKELLGHESLNTLKHYALLTIVDLKKTHAKCHPRERKDGR